MKATIVLAVVAAFMAAACGAPGGSSHSSPKWSNIIKTTINTIQLKELPTSDPVIDWVHAAELTQDLRGLVNLTAHMVATLAVQADPVHGSEIASIAFRDQAKIDEVMVKMQEDIKKQTLNSEQVVEYTRDVVFRMALSAMEIEPLLENLPKEASDAIRMTYESTFTTVTIVVDEILELFKADWGNKMF